MYPLNRFSQKRTEKSKDHHSNGLSLIPDSWALVLLNLCSLSLNVCRLTVTS